MAKDRALIRVIWDRLIQGDSPITFRRAQDGDFPKWDAAYTLGLLGYRHVLLHSSTCGKSNTQIRCFPKPGTRIYWLEGLLQGCYCWHCAHSVGDQAVVQAGHGRVAETFFGT